ncbi:argonaute-binding 1-like [Lecanosticta acicola]|uniref:Argonaute-binding 1-like n=1 Tax=Lecanosticta acicola TaxID=111012 RepID=A0AAI8YU81_9PEZI|nr:argonaute-binding 1-like [Lecanosticta acicola]
MAPPPPITADQAALWDRQQQQGNEWIAQQHRDSTTEMNITLADQTALWSHQRQQGNDWTDEQRGKFDAQMQEHKLSLRTLPHPDMDEIIRQVEFYFSDENLPSDAHLLSKTGNFGDEFVSLNEILGFRKMRRFKPKSRVIAALKESQKLEIYKNNKYIRRKEPLKIPLRVTPKVDSKREEIKKLIEQPWLTKGILKPTGFEATYAEPPLKPEEWEEERLLFNPEEAFAVRIERAIVKYTSRRKFHQDTRLVFSKFLMFGGFAQSNRMFVGGVSKNDLEDMSKEEQSDVMAQFSVHDQVWDGLEVEEGDPTWIVDFETLAKAFLSSPFMASFDWRDHKTQTNATNVLRNFYNYLMHHDVCPEYQDQIIKAIEVCDLAEDEFPKLAKVDAALPGTFNVACSTIHNGAHANMRPIDPTADWVIEGDYTGLSDKDAEMIFFAGVTAHCSAEQIAEVVSIATVKGRLETVLEEQMGLEVVGVEHTSDQAKQVYNDDRIKDTIIKSTGKLICKRWKMPNARPRDIPEDTIEDLRAKRSERLEFLMEEEILQSCYPGLKFSAVVKQLSNGIKWIDSFDFTYPSFFTWIPNEDFPFPEQGAPKAWMARQMEKQQNERSVVRREDEGADEMPE